MPSMLAAVDIGTNSFHLVVARVSDEGRFEVVTSERELVRLGRGAGDMKVLEPEAMDRAVACLTRMRRIAESFGAPLRAVATSATREAENQHEFIERVRREAGVDVEVIAGIEEARLIHLGVLQAVPAFERRMLLCDIGGGSTEILIGQRGETLAARSMKLGAIRLSDRFFPDGTCSAAAVKACRAFVRSTLSVAAQEFVQLGHQVAVGSSGTIEACARIAHAAERGAELRTYNCFEFTRPQLDQVVNALTSARTSTARRRVPGLSADRVDIAVAGALILEGVFSTFEVNAMTVSDYALREGVLLDTAQRSTDVSGNAARLREVVRAGVRQLVEACDDDPAHSERVARLALDLFDQTSALHGLGPRARGYLEAGALLANVGLFISHNRHHLHSYYVIRNSEHLTGLTDGEIEIIAQVARYHRKSAPKPSHAEFDRLLPEHQSMVRWLAAILRVAIGLDRSHDGRVGAVVANRRGSTLFITAITAAAVDIELELYAAQERSALLAEVAGCRVRVVGASPVETSVGVSR